MNEIETQKTLSMIEFKFPFSLYWFKIIMHIFFIFENTMILLERSLCVFLFIRKLLHLSLSLSRGLKIKFFTLLT